MLNVLTTKLRALTSMAGKVACRAITLAPLLAGLILDDLAAQAPSLEATAEDLRFFETHVRPLLVEHCYECHSGEARKGSLSLDSRAGIFDGGDSGSAVVPGEPDQSLLIQAVRYDGLEMPPNEKLSDDDVNHLAQWVRRGAAWPDDGGQGPGKRTRPAGITDDDRQHWAFQPVRATAPPDTATTKHPIDAFIDSRLADEGLTANAPASTRTLIRRVWFGLSGLPPTFEELETWTKRLGSEDGSAMDESVYNELIDELLNQPAYGEHWARHWLDVVRFAQSNGYERDGYKPYSWRYRDYVVQAFQNDKPYDRFVLEQLAGDELVDSNSESRVATGFYRLGVWDDEPDDARQAEFDDLDDVMVTVGASFMGLTIGCARCHDHKFDPIPQTDYYRLLAFLRNVRRYENPTTSLQNATALPISDDAAIRNAFAAFKERQQAREQAIASADNDEAKKQAESQPLDLNLPGLDWALGVRENEGTPPPTHVLIRGNSGSPGAEVTPGFLQVLSPASQTIEHEHHATASEGEPSGSVDAAEAVAEYHSESPLNDLIPSSGRRLALARWLTDPQHPLTARVIVNRVWHYHFGRGIVETTGDFGLAGDRPKHPELLDWLADDFVNNGWSIKHLHRMILTSQAWRRASQIDIHRPAHRLALEKDPGNRLLWRSSLRRLDAEAIRDRMLLTSGELNRTVGGSEMYPRLSGEVLAGQSRPGLDWKPSPPDQRARRSLYAVVKRGVRDPLLEAFDYSNVTSPLTERPVTTVAPQALMMLHGRFTAERARFLAKRIGNQHIQRVDQVRELFQTVLQRPPSEHELAVSLQSLDEFERELQQIAGQISFRPDVPVSLYGEYRRDLPGEQFLLGPAESWKYFSGTWGSGYEGIEAVEPRLGPFALWQGGQWSQGILQGQFRLDANVSLLTLISRASSRDDSWQGLGITWDRASGTVEGRDRSTDAEEIVSAPLTLTPETWIPFRWEVTGNRSRFWIGDSDDERPVVDQTINDTDPQAGHLGVAVWGGQVDFDALQWTPLASPTSPAANASAEETPATSLATDSDHPPSPIDLARTSVVLESNSLPIGWSRYDGDWRRENDGTWQVGPNHGAKLLWDAQPVHRGEVQVEMMMSPGNAHIAGLLLSVADPQVGADNWFGYEVSLNADEQTVFVGDHRNNFRLLTSHPTTVTAGKWHTLRAVLEQQRLSVYVDNQSEPSINMDLPDRLTGQLVGLRTWGSDVHFRNFTVQDFTEQTDSERHVAQWPQSAAKFASPRDDIQWSNQQALAALCRTIFNLSEFLYVD